jgi:hypothetical protein
MPHERLIFSERRNYKRRLTDRLPWYTFALSVTLVFAWYVLLHT